MPFYFRAGCRSSDEAIRAFHSASHLFDQVDEVSSMASKRSGQDVLFRFDDPEPVTAKCLAVLHASGLFEQIDPTDAVDFETSRSDAV